MSRLIGYARVSTKDQNLDMQIDALLKEGCKLELIFTDKASGKDLIRAGFMSCINELKSGDTLVVWNIDRLSRTSEGLMQLCKFLNEKKVKLTSITQRFVDLESSQGRYAFNLLAANAQFEVDCTKERINKGLESARSRGRVGGRPKITNNNMKVAAVRELSKDPTMDKDKICRIVNISTRTYYRYLNI